MVTCPICEKQMNYINNAHLKVHNMTPNEFKEQYPSCIMISENIKQKLSRKDNINFINSVQIRSDKKKLKTLTNFQLLDRRCKKCNEKILFEKRKNNFCSQSCAASYNLIGRKTVYSKEALFKMKEVGKRNVDNLLKGRTVKKALQKECKICGNIFEVFHTKKNKKNCSPECFKIYRSKFNAAQGSYSKSGYYKGIFCASTWELAFLIYHLDQGHNIKRCDITFEYMLDDGPHTYFPDFMINQEIYEIKGRELADVEHKTNAVIKAGYKIHMIRRSNIPPFIAYVKKEYNIKDLTSLYE